MKPLCRYIYLLTSSYWLSGCGFVRMISRGALGDEYFLERIARSKPFTLFIVATAGYGFYLLLQTQGKQHGSSDSKKQLAFILVGFSVLSILYKFFLWMEYFAKPEPY